MKNGIEIPTIETIYHTSHSLTHTSMILQGDTIVNTALDNALTRESEWTHKKSTVVASEAVHTHAMNLNCFQGEMPTFPDERWDKEKAKLTQEIKASVKLKVYSDSLEVQKKHLDTLLKQGEYLKFAQQEECDPSWKSILYNLPKGTMKFILNSLTHTLPTQDNLKLWGKAFSDKCNLCKNRDSTSHCLSGCKVSLDQGRFTWRHNNIVNFIVNSVDKSRFTVYSDLPGHQASNGGSLPPSMIVTNLKPDIVILDEKNKKAVSYEMTVPFETNIHKQHKYKSDKYAHFETDITSYDTTVIAFEVGARGGLTNENTSRLSEMHKQYMLKHTKKATFIKNIKSLATLSSYYIYTARKHPSWEHTSYVNPPF